MSSPWGEKTRPKCRPGGQSNFRLTWKWLKTGWRWTVHRSPRGETASTSSAGQWMELSSMTKQEGYWFFATSLSPGATEFFGRPLEPRLHLHHATRNSIWPQRSEPSRSSANASRVACGVGLPVELSPNKMTWKRSRQWQSAAGNWALASR